jgi:hypothetical protein
VPSSAAPGPLACPRGVKAVAVDLSCPETAALLLEGVAALFLHPRAVRRRLAVGNRGPSLTPD